MIIKYNKQISITLRKAIRPKKIMCRTNDSHADYYNSTYFGCSEEEHSNNSSNLYDSYGEPKRYYYTKKQLRRMRAYCEKRHLGLGFEENGKVFFYDLYIQEPLDEEYEREKKETQEYLDNFKKSSKKKKKVDYKYYANLDPTEEFSEFDLYVNLVSYRLFFSISETRKKVSDEQITFDNVREHAYNLALKRTAYYKRYFTKERIIKNKLYKKVRTYRLIISQILLHIANVYLNYVYWFFIICYRCLKIIFKFFFNNAYLIFIEYPKSSAIQRLTIKDKFFLYCILYFEFLMIFTFSIKIENKKLKTSSDDHEINSLIARRRNSLTKRHRDSLPFVIKPEKFKIPLKNCQLEKKKIIEVKNYSYIFKSVKELFKMRSRHKHKYKRRMYKRKFMLARYPLYKRYIKDIFNFRNVQKNVINRSFRSWNMKKNIQKQLVGYQFPELNLVNSEQEAKNIPDLYVSVAQKSKTLPYNVVDFDNDINSYIIESKPDDELTYSGGFFRQSQAVADPVTSTKDLLVYATMKKFSPSWHGYRDYDLYLDYLDEIGTHWFIVSQADYNRLLAYERRKLVVPKNFLHQDDNTNVPLTSMSSNFDLNFPVSNMLSYLDVPVLHQLDKKDPESWRKLFLMKMKNNQTGLYEGPLLPFNKNRDIFFGGFLECKFDLPSLFSVFDTSIAPDRLRRKSVYNFRGSKRYKGRVRRTKLFSNYERGSFRKRLWANLFPAEQYNRLLLNEYKSAKHMKEDANAVIVRRINKGERITTGNASYLAFPEYYSIKSRFAIAGNINRSFQRAYRSNLMKFEEKRDFEGSKKLESELFTDNLVKVVRDFNGNVVDQDTINAHIGKGGSLRMKFENFGYDEYSNGVFVELLPLNREIINGSEKSGFHNFIDLNKKGKYFTCFFKFRLLNNLLNPVVSVFEMLTSFLFAIGSIDIFGLIPEYIALIDIESTEDIFVKNSITLLLCFLLLFNNVIIVLFFKKIQTAIIRSMSIHLLDYLYNLEDEYNEIPVFSTIRHYIADWFNLSYFLPYTIYKKFDIDFGSVVGIDRYVTKFHELFEVVGYKPLLYEAPNFLKKSIQEERKFLRESLDLKETRQTHLILSGAPGTGKTYLVKALGGELGIPVLLFTPNQFIGGLEDKVQRLFEKAERMTPCIIFIDEIDSVGYARPNIDLGGELVSVVDRPDSYKSFSKFLRDRRGFSTIDIYKNGNPFTGYIGSHIAWRDGLNQMGLTPTEELFVNIEGYVDRKDETLALYLKSPENDRSMLYRLLIECDGITGRLANKPESKYTWSVLNLLRKRRGIGVIGATNRYNVLDPALTRVGRFHTRLHFETLNERERYYLFQMNLGLNLNFDENIDWSYFMKMTSGWTPAEVAGVVAHANMIAYQEKVLNLSCKMLNDSMNYMLGINLVSDREFVYKEKGDLLLFKQASRLFFDHVFQTGSNRDVYSKYNRGDNADLVNYQKKIASYFTIHDKDRKFFEEQLIGLLGSKIGEIFYLLYKRPIDFDSPENPMIITFENDITVEYVIVFVLLMINYWCLYSDDSLVNGEALLGLDQHKRFILEGGDNILDVLAIKIMSARTDHPEYHYLHDLFHFVFNKTPYSLVEIGKKLDWLHSYSIQFGSGRATETINPYVAMPIRIYGHYVSLKFTSSILLDFIGFQGDAMEQNIYKIINEALIRGFKMLLNNLEAFEFVKEKLEESEYLKILDMKDLFKKTTIKINYNYETNK